MRTVHSIAELRDMIHEWRNQGERIALVPTMGNLHSGHIHLMAQAAQCANRVVASIFVNPMQFGVTEDFTTYPRTIAADSIALAENGVHALFAPDVSEIYPGIYPRGAAAAPALPATHRDVLVSQEAECTRKGYAVDCKALKPQQPRSRERLSAALVLPGTANTTRVEVAGLTDILCGASRPGHFVGVATVVNKFFNIVQPDIAVFGEKDYQQLLVIRRMVLDLCLPITILGVPTVREADGLAMSSRNSYLTMEQRSVAPRLYQTVRTAHEYISRGARHYAVLAEEGMQSLRDAGFTPDYFTVRQKYNLLPPEPGDSELIVLAAAWLGNTRLIDNMKIEI